MAAAATSLSFFMEAFGLEVEEEDVDWHMAHGTKRSLVESGSRSSDVEASERSSRSGFFQTHDLGTKWPHWHTLISKVM